MKTIQLLITVSLLLITSTLAFAEQVVVIVNQSNQQKLNIEQIKAIYTDNIIRWDNGTRIRAYDLPIDDFARQVFSEKILGMSAMDAAREQANRKITNASKNPTKTKRQRSVLASVRRNTKAIGYVSASAIKKTNGIRVVLTLK